MNVKATTIPGTFVLLAFGLVAGPAPAREGTGAAIAVAGPKDPASAMHRFLGAHCQTCNDGGEAEADLDLTGLGWNPGDAANFARWTRILDRMARGEMPPSGEPRPAAAEQQSFADELSALLFEASLAAQRNEGRVVFRRLNRDQYERTLSELLGISVPLRQLLPEDATAEGFDTVAAAHSISAVHLERYLEAADLALAAAADLRPAVATTTIRTDAVVGHTFELRFRDRLTAYLGRFLRRGKVVGNESLLDAIEPSVTTEEAQDFLRADIVAKGLVNDAETYVVVEVSSTVDTKDIVRAERQAAILRKAGLAAIPLVACAAIAPESLDFAHRSGVHVWCNGSIVDAAA